MTESIILCDEDVICFGYIPPEVTSVKPCGSMKIWLEFQDDVRGELDVSYLTNEVLRDANVFNRVHVTEAGAVSWGYLVPDDPMTELDACPHVLYARLLGVDAAEFKDMDAYYDEIERQSILYHART